MNFIVYRVAPGAVTHAETIEARDPTKALEVFKAKHGFGEGDSPYLMAMSEAEHEERMGQHREIPACVGCGSCCTKSKCAVANITYGNVEGKCPALEWDVAADRYWCAIQKKARGAELNNIRKLLFIGVAAAPAREGGCGGGHLG